MGDLHPFPRLIIAFADIKSGREQPGGFQGSDRKLTVMLLALVRRQEMGREWSVRS